MILQLLSDDKFADYVINQFANDAQHNELVLICDSPKVTNIQHIDKVCVISPISNEFESLVNNISRYRAIVFHGLFWPWQEKILKQTPNNIKVAWMFWGGEIYGRHDLIQNFLLPQTRLYYHLHMFKNRLDNNSRCKYEFPRDLLNRIDYCLTGVDEEVQYARKYANKEFAHLWYTYYSIEETLGPLINESCKGNDIFIGNSSTIENNHLDSFKVIQKMQISDRNVIVPLSYGSIWLKNLVLRKGKKIFQDKFHPLQTFLPREEYNNKMLNCNIMVMPHHRPQAQGNILTGLWLGMRVFLSENSMTFSFFKRIGAIIFSIEKDLVRTNPEALRPLSTTEREKNREVLIKLYSKDNVMRAVKEVTIVLDN